MLKKPSFYLLCILAITSVIVGRTLLDKMLCFGYLLFLLGILWGAIEAVKGVFQQHYKFAVIFFSVLLVAAVSGWKSIREYVAPVVSSGLVEINYDFNSEDFKKSHRIETKCLSGICSIEKIEGDKFQICFPREIEEMIQISTSWDSIGRRHTWKLGEDFDPPKGKCIESRHYLNEPWGPGRHMIQFRYRLSLLELLREPSKVIFK